MTKKTLLLWTLMTINPYPVNTRVCPQGLELTVLYQSHM